MALSVAFMGSPAEALDPPKVVVTYSLECTDGGRFVQAITGTESGLGNQVFDMCVENEGSDGAIVITDTPQIVEVEYSADPDTQSIVDGPVELIRAEMRQVFEVLAVGVSTTHSDLSVSMARGSTGTLAANRVKWNPALPYQSSTLGCTDCFGNALICSLAAPPGGWPRCEDGSPKDRPLPLWSIANGPSGRATRFSGDNLTPENPEDDILANFDAQAVVYNTWIGAELDRSYVPEPGAWAMLASALLGLAGVRRIRGSSRRRL